MVVLRTSVWNVGRVAHTNVDVELLMLEGQKLDAAPLVWDDY